MALYRSTAIILRSRNLGEADRVLVLLSEDLGKIEAVVKGARRQRSRFVGNTLPFNVINGLFFTGKNLDTLSQAELVHSFAALHEDLIKLAYASYWMELVDAFLPEREEAGEIYRFLLAALIVLEQSPEPEVLNLAFQIRILNYLGYQPHLNHCSSCDHPLEGTELWFSAEVGGVICKGCRAQTAGEIEVDLAEMDLYQQLAQTDLRQLNQLTILTGQCRKLRKILQDFIGFRLERPLKSQTFLDNVLS